jgi:hypothetical protein
MSYDCNPYYNPEALGLETVAELEFSDMSYQFDTLVVWKHKDSGKFYTARDSGCSCPTPFEEYCGIDKLTELNDWTDLLSDVDTETEEYLESQKKSDGYYWGNPNFPGDAASFLGTVRSAMLSA